MDSHRAVEVTPIVVTGTGGFNAGVLVQYFHGPENMLYAIYLERSES